MVWAPESGGPCPTAELTSALEPITTTTPTAGVRRAKPCMDIRRKRAVLPRDNGDPGERRRGRKGGKRGGVHGCDGRAWLKALGALLPTLLLLSMLGLGQCEWGLVQAPYRPATRVAEGLQPHLHRLLTCMHCAMCCNACLSRSSVCRVFSS